MLLENDLFPTGSIELEAIDNLGRITDEQILGCAAALTESAGLELGRVLTGTTKERFGITFTARDVRLVEGGVTALSAPAVSCSARRRSWSRWAFRSNPVIRVRSICIWLWITRSQAC